jgi:type II secretory pathway pseudopilin PulG
MIMREIKIRRAFTITELLVAVGLLAAVLAASTTIFHYAIDAQRTAMATAEIMRTMRAITDQLNMDFAGLRTSDAPMIIKFRGNPNDANQADSIVFFAAGDFQDSNGVMRSNIARIYYGQSGFVHNVCPNPYSHILTNINDPCDLRNKILARKQVILEPNLPTTTRTNEYDPNSLSQLVNRYLASDPNIPANRNIVDANGWIARSDVNPANAGSIPMYLAKGVDNFSIMYCYKSDIVSPGGALNWQRPVNEKRFFGILPRYSYFKLYPDMIKFTFTLYDSKGILKTGRRFEHIVYIGN